MKLGITILAFSGLIQPAYAQTEVLDMGIGGQVSGEMCEQAGVNIETALELQMTLLETIDNMLPLTIAGAKITTLTGAAEGGGDNPLGDIDSIKDANVDDVESAFLCTCAVPPPVMFRYGITMDWWDPVGLVDTTSVPYCVPPLGISLNLGNGVGSAVSGAMKGVGPAMDKVLQALGILMPGQSSGASNGIGGGMQITQRASHAKDGVQEQAMHTHFISLLSAIQLMSEAVFYGCFSMDTNYLPYFSELNPFWAKDQWSVIQAPETLLAANPLGPVICMAEAATNLFGFNLDELFWCAGNWGVIYPLSPNVQGVDYIQASAMTVVKNLYSRFKTFQMFDTAGYHMMNYVCQPLPTFFIPKRDTQMYPVFPITTGKRFPIGTTELGWGAGQDSPVNMGVMTWQIYQKRDCCYL